MFIYSFHVSYAHITAPASVFWLSGSKRKQILLQPRLIGNTCLYIHFCNTVIMYLAARFAAVSKWNVQRVALKHTFNTWPWHVLITLVQAHIAVFFIMLLEVRFAAIHNSNIRWVSLKIKLYEVGSIPYTNPTLNLPDSVIKCKSNIKTYSADAAMLF